MRGAAAQWGLAGLASVLAHLGFAAALALTLRPDPVPPEPSPQARFDLSAEPVAQVAAQPRAAEGTPAPEGRADAAQLAAGVVPTGRATPVPPPAGRAAPIAPTTTTAPATPARGESLAGAPPPAAPVRPTSTDSATLAPAPPRGDAATAAEPAAETAPAVTASAQALAGTATEAPRLTATEGPATAATARPPPTEDLPAAAPPVEPAPAVDAPAQALASTATEASRLTPAAGAATAASARPPPTDALPAATPTVDQAAAAALPQTMARVAEADAPSLAARDPGAEVAPPTAAQAQPAPAIQAAGDRLALAATASDRVATLTPEASPAPAAAPATQRLAGSDTPAPTLAGSALEAPVLAGAAPAVAAAPAASPRAETLASATTEAPAVAASPPVAPPPLAGLPPRAQGLAPDPPGQFALIAAAAPATGTRAQAALAWTGGDTGQIDPVSLAAIQSFMQPADLAGMTAGADPVRDGITALLAAVPCARMQTVFLPETGTLELRGHVPEEGLRAPVLAALRDQVGAAIPVSDNVRILPRPQCNVLAGIAALGLPQSTVQETDPRLIGADAHAREYAYVEGQELTFEMTSPDYPAHVYIDYFDAAGMVLHLQPNEMLDTTLLPPKSTLDVGHTPDGQEAFRITVAPPFGNEIAVAFAASRPIHDTPRPVREPAGPYLDWLRDRIAAAREADPDFKGEWVYFFMSTAPRSP